MQRAFAALLLAGLATGCEQPNEFAAPPPPKVTVSPPMVGDITTFEERTARVDALKTVDVRARVTGILEELHFTSGTDVEEGELLAQLEPDQFEANVAAADAALASREADLGIKEVYVEKVKIAFDRGAANEIELKEAEAERDAAAAAVRSAEAELERQNIDLSYTDIYAPLSGRASRNLVDVGNLVSAADATLITTIVMVDPIYVYFDVSERELLDFLQERAKEEGISTAQVNDEKVRAELTLSNGTDYDDPGEIDFANNVVDPDTGTIEVRAVFPNSRNVLVPGTFVRIRVPRLVEDAMVVPEFALQRDIVGTFLLVVNSENTVERRDVVLGKLTRKGRIIDSGIGPDDHVIVNGLQRSRPGITVQPEMQPARPDDVDPENDTVPSAE